MKTIEGNYIKEFDATVVACSNDQYISLDRSAFYPEGGGQPSDTGIVEWPNHESKVLKVVKKNVVQHLLEGAVPPENIVVHGILDWERRYAHMKMHTAQHIISGVVYDAFNAQTVGNQIHADYSRVDFFPAIFSSDDLKIIENRCNEIIMSKSPVLIYTEDRIALERRVDQQRCNLNLLPKSIRSLRIVEIANFDVCPCAGTHVKNTEELSPLNVLRTESKGKDKQRLVYTFKE